jgi:hypothetical protein
MLRIQKLCVANRDHDDDEMYVQPPLITYAESHTRFMQTLSMHKMRALGWNRRLPACSTVLKQLPTQCPGVYLSQPVAGEFTGTWPFRLGESQMRQ